MNRKSVVTGLALGCVIILGSGKVDARKIPSGGPHATLLVTGLASGSGSTIGPGGDLYVTEGATGRVLRVDPKTGDVSTFASGLPNWIVGIGGAMDIAFIDRTAYVLVTLVGTDVAQHVVGIYRVDGPPSFTVVADIGQFSVENPPSTPFFVSTGVQYALDTYRGGFLVTDGHHNRMLWVQLDGEVTEVIAFDNIVPTGLAVSGNSVYMAEAGPTPHLPEAGKVVSFGTKSPTATEVAAARGSLSTWNWPGRTLYAHLAGVLNGVAEVLLRCRTPARS